MGDAADDLYEAEMDKQELLLAARARGDKPCPACIRRAMQTHDCPTCGGTGWLDKDGNPTELW